MPGVNDNDVVAKRSAIMFIPNSPRHREECEKRLRRLAQRNVSSNAGQTMLSQRTVNPRMSAHVPAIRIEPDESENG